MRICFLFSHLVTILDDSEFYESEEPFAQHEYALLGTFVNQFLYRAVWGGALLGKTILVLDLNVRVNSGFCHVRTTFHFFF